LAVRRSHVLNVRKHKSPKGGIAEATNH
jgi:hypothetical protein